MANTDNTNNENTHKGEITMAANENTASAIVENTNTNNENIFAPLTAIFNNANTIEELAASLRNTDNLPIIDARQAYKFLENGKHNAESKALSAITTKLASLFENTGKAAGISTIYNVLDARTTRKVAFTRKLAYNLQGSKALAQFMAMAAMVSRNERGRLATSVNGVEFMQNRNAYTTRYTDSKGNDKVIRKAQHSEAMSAIRKGNAMAITNTNKRKGIVGEAVELVTKLVSVEAPATPIA